MTCSRLPRGGHHAIPTGRTATVATCVEPCRHRATTHGLHVLQGEIFFIMHGPGFTATWRRCDLPNALSVWRDLGQGRHAMATVLPPTMRVSTTTRCQVRTALSCIHVLEGDAIIEMQSLCGRGHIRGSRGRL